jgi:urease accessory protein UreF
LPCAPAATAARAGRARYSQGPEAAIEVGIVRDAARGRWIATLEFSIARMEAPVFQRLCDAWRARRRGRRPLERPAGEPRSAELRAESAQMGIPWHGCSASWVDGGPAAWEEVSLPAAFARCRTLGISMRATR